jgi:hypothetical protein
MFAPNYLLKAQSSQSSKAIGMLPLSLCDRVCNYVCVYTCVCVCLSVCARAPLLKPHHDLTYTAV